MGTATRRLLLSVVLPGLIVLASCARGPERACEGIAGKAGHAPQQAYLACGRAMLDSMEHLDSLTDKLVARDEASQREAFATLQQLRKMMRDAGDVKAFREAGDEAQVVRLNRSLATAFEIYDLALFGVVNPFKQLRETSAHNMQLAKEFADTARMNYVAIR